MSAVDPLDKERTDELPKSSHVSKKDLRVLGISLAIGALLLAPAYYIGRGFTYKYLCGKNFESMGKALNLYLAESDDRLPPVSNRNGEPVLDSDGHIQCWASIPLFRGNMREGTSLACPAAGEDEAVPLGAANHGSEPLTYGMYQGLSAVPRSSIADPGNTLVIAETSNYGSNDTYDPVKYLDEAGQPIRYDGYVFAWDTSNSFPTDQTKSVTRLAYPGTSNGVFKKDGPSRHSGGNHYVTLDGRRLILPPSAARILMNKATLRPENSWRIPDTYVPFGGFR